MDRNIDLNFQLQNIFVIRTAQTVQKFKKSKELTL